MEAFIMSLLIAAGLAWYLRHLFKTSDHRHRSDAPQSTPNEISDDPIEEAERTLQAAISNCRNDHPAAAQALMWLAATDGTISKQEARNIFRFCEQQGTALPPGTYDAIEYLNNGVTLDSSRAESAVRRDLEQLAAMPAKYKVEFFGVASAICGNNKRVSKTKQDFLDLAKGLIT